MLPLVKSRTPAVVSSGTIAYSGDSPGVGCVIWRYTILLSWDMCEEDLKEDDFLRERHSVFLSPVVFPTAVYVVATGP